MSDQETQNPPGDQGGAVPVLAIGAIVAHRSGRVNEPALGEGQGEREGQAAATISQRLSPQRDQGVSG